MEFPMSLNVGTSWRDDLPGRMRASIWTYYVEDPNSRVFNNRSSMIVCAKIGITGSQRLPLLRRMGPAGQPKATRHQLPTLGSNHRVASCWPTAWVILANPKTDFGALDR